MQENSDPFLAKNLEPTPEKVEILLRLLTPFISSYYKDGVKLVLGSGHKFLAKTYDKEEEESFLKILKERYFEKFPSEPESDVEGVLCKLFNDFIPNSLNSSSGGCFAYFPGGGNFYAAISDLIASMINRYTTITSFCPALAGIDKQVVKWLCEMVGYTNVAESGGILLSGGSLANFMGILCARHHNLKVPENYHKGIVYCSDQTHCSILRGCYLAGIQAKNIKKFPTSIQSNFEIDFKELEAQIEKDLKTNEGIPFLLICNVGTTNTGKIENLQESLRISKKFNLWLHGDGCYSTCYTLLQDCKENYFKGLGEFDSISTDPHKGLFSPYGLGAFLIKQWKLLYNTFSFKTEDIAYYPSSMENNDDLLNSKLLSDSFDLGIENSRDFKALKLWLPLRLLGVNTFKNYLKEKLQLADYLYKELIKEKDLEIISHNFTVIVFRYYEKNSEKTLQEWNNINKKFLININSSVTVAISQTFLREKDSEELLFVCRACVICVRTHKENVIELIESIRNSLEYIKNISKKNE